MLTRQDILARRDEIIAPCHTLSRLRLQDILAAMPRKRVFSNRESFDGPARARADV